MECGPKERAWRLDGYLVIEDEALPRPLVIVFADAPPVACIPSWARGWCRETMFGWCMADLREQRDGWLGMLRALQRLGLPIASALVAATLALGLNYADGLNALEAMLRQVARLVG